MVGNLGWEGGYIWRRHIAVSFFAGVVRWSCWPGRFLFSYFVIPFSFIFFVAFLWISFSSLFLFLGFTTHMDGAFLRFKFWHQLPTHPDFVCFNRTVFL